MSAVLVCPVCRRRVVPVDGLCRMCGTSVVERPAGIGGPSRRPQAAAPAHAAPAHAAPAHATPDLDQFVDADLISDQDAGFLPEYENEDTDPNASMDAAIEAALAADAALYRPEYDVPPAETRSAQPPEERSPQAPDPHAAAPAPREAAIGLGDASDPYTPRSELVGRPPAPPSAAPPARKAKAPAEGAPQRRQTVLGWILLTVAYAIAAATGLAYEHYTSDVYVIARHVEEADALFGDDQGRGVDSDRLLRAAERYLDALLIDPDMLRAHQHLESIRWRFEERRETFPPLLLQRHAALAARSKYGRTPGGFSGLPVGPLARYGIEGHEATLKQHAWWWAAGFALLVVWTFFRWVWIRIHPDERPIVERDDTAQF